MVLALVLFILTVINLGKWSTAYVETFIFKPGTVEVMGVNPNFDTFQGSILQRRAFRTSGVFPLYGSSEMSMIKDYHPAKVFTSETGFTPFLIGKGGSQTLIHVLNLAAQGENLKGKKLAIFLTPQWYGPGGIPQSTFGGNFSPLHAYEMLENKTLSVKAKQQIAERILQFPEALNDYPYLKKRLESVSKESVEFSGRYAWQSMQDLIDFLPSRMEYTSLEIEDLQKTIWYVEELPNQAKPQHSKGSRKPSWRALEAQAVEEARASIGTNPFGMDEGFYKEHIEPKLKEKLDSDKEAKLYPSPEYGDLQLLLQVLKEQEAKPLFVIIPMNGRWYDYTGFSRSERQACYQRLNNIIKEKGFPVADFTPHEYDEYFLRDPWHLAWKGWLAVDQELEKFYMEN
jgi:D-alanine transfer protein